MQKIPNNQCMKKLIDMSLKDNTQISAEKRIEIINAAYDSFRRCVNIENMLGDIGLYIGESDDGSLGEIYSIKSNAANAIWAVLKQDDEYGGGEIYDILWDAVKEHPNSKTMPSKAAKEIIAMLEEIDNEQSDNSDEE